MRYFIFILLIICANRLCAQKSVYDVQLQTIDSVYFKLSNFKGKKILVAVSTPEKLHEQKSAFYDSLQNSNPQIKVIIIPGVDLGGKDDILYQRLMMSDISKRVTICMPTKVKKSANANQNELLKWLTTLSSNRHFDLDIRADEQMYVISETGVLYAVFEPSVTQNQLKDVLATDDVQN